MSWDPVIMFSPLFAFFRSTQFSWSMDAFFPSPPNDFSPSSAIPSSAALDVVFTPEIFEDDVKIVDLPFSYRSIGFAPLS